MFKINSVTGHCDDCLLAHHTEVFFRSKKKKIIAHKA